MRHGQETQYFIKDNPVERGYDLYIRAQDITGKLSFGSIVMEPHTPGAIAPKTVLEDTEAQLLMDSLWQAGLRPNIDRVDSQGVIKAKDEHINDLRLVLQAHLKESNKPL